MRRFPWPRTTLVSSALLACLLAGGAGQAGAAPGRVERFPGDPLAGGSNLPFFAEGDAASRFTHLATAPAFPGDRPGTLRVLYDTTLPTARISTPLGAILATDSDVTFGAILTVRSEGFAADPNGFSQIAFGLWNTHTTGMNRTGFPADSYDLLEVDWFPNVGEFGGPFLSPTVFGGNVGDNAFFNFGFNSVESALPLDTPLLVQATYRATTRVLDVTMYRHTGGTVFTAIPGASVAVDLSGLAPGYLVDALGIAAYGEGWPSLHATVDYDLLFAGPLPAPFRTTRGGMPRPAPGPDAPLTPRPVAAAPLVPIP
jgi:hypothetical protein